MAALPSSPEQGSQERLFPKYKRNIFKEKKALKTPGQVTSVCAPSISCMKFLYSIFLAVGASLFAEGWERPNVSGTRPSVTIVQVCLVSRVWPHPNHTTSISLMAHGMPRPAQQVPSAPPHRAASPSGHSILGERDCRAGQGCEGHGAAFCHLAGQAVTWPPSVGLCSGWQGPAVQPGCLVGGLLTRERGSYPDPA